MRKNNKSINQNKQQKNEQRKTEGNTYARMRAISVADSPPAPFKASLGAGRSATYFMMKKGWEKRKELGEILRR